MGRSSTTGLPFLISRKTGKNGPGKQPAIRYLYHRVVANDLAPFICGPINLPWASSSLQLEGRATIKISLNTANLEDARQRWGFLHPQIEALVQLAKLRIRAAAARSLRVNVNQLMPDDIKQMVGQVRHDILAGDDLTYMDPQFTAPLTDISYGLLQRAGQPSGPRTRAQARRIGQDVLKQKAESHLADRDIALFDQGIEEGEVDASPELIGKLAAVRDGGRVEDLVLTEEETQSLLKTPERTSLISSDVDSILAENGIYLPSKHPDRQQLALAILRAEINAYRTVQARRSGDVTETPERPPRLQVPETPAQGATLSEVRAIWINEVKPKTKARDDNALYVRRFIDMFGDVPISTITRKMIREWRNKLEKCPRNPSKELAKASLQDQIACGATKEECRMLSRRTINSKAIGSISALMNIAIEEEMIETNPCKNAGFKKVETEDRLPYSTTDLNKIFSGPVYIDDKRMLGSGADAAFWMPLIALYAGARLEEIGQLLVADIREEHGILFFDFIEIDDEAETAGTTPESKDLKTPNSRRQVPVHPLLIAFGFQIYVERTKKAGHKFLFPALNPYRGKRTHNWSKWWARYTDKNVTKSMRKVFHSFRHNFSDAIRKAAKGNEEVVKSLVGHKKPMYGSSIDLETRYDIICKLAYRGVDFDQVTSAAKRFYSSNACGD